MTEDEKPSIKELAEDIQSSPRELKVTVPSCFLDRARELIERYPEFLSKEKVKLIKFQCGMRHVTKPKIFFHKSYPLILSIPQRDPERMKLVALLYAIGRILDVELDVLFADPGKRNHIATKHSKGHRGKVQRAIDKMIEDPSRMTRKDAEGVKEAKPLTYMIDNVEVSKEAYEKFDSLDSEVKELWREFGHYSTKKGRISGSSRTRLLVGTGYNLEDVYCLNEGTLGEHGLAFEIDYGEIDFCEYMAKVLELEGRIEELEGVQSAEEDSSVD